MPRIRRACVLAALLLLCAGPAAAQSTAQLQRMYLTHLEREGYRGSVDKDGDIEFKYEGGTYYILVDSTDAKYFAVLYPNFWPIESQAELAQAFRAASSATWDSKVAKILVNKREDDVSAVYGIALERPEQFGVFLRQALAGLQAAVGRFVEGMKE